ncbi:MAG: exodeoxyribonuclease V subunit gamma, partial [Actinomycetes bacterium]
MLRVTVADRPEDLLDLLVEGLSAAPADLAPGVFDRDWIGVANLGMRNWLTRNLAQRLGATDGRTDGVVANLDTQLSGALRWRVLAALRHHDGALSETDDPWQVPRLTWTLFEMLTQGGEGVHPRLSEVPAGGTLAARAASLAELFDRYSVHRPGMVLAWLDGRRVGGDGLELAPSAEWQFDLFRAVADRVGEQHDGLEPPAARTQRAVELLRAGELTMRDHAPTRLPSRLAMFGVAALDPEAGALLDALGVGRTVDLYLVTPSVPEFRRIVEEVRLLGPSVPAPTVSWSFARPDAQHPSDHPILDTWAARPMDSARMLGALGLDHSVRASGPQDGLTLLARLQTDLHAGRVGTRPHPLVGADTSFQVHAAPGLTRQVEVVRDVLLGLLR